jgi:tetratricopeptide (TPR) repeat protein
MTINEFLKTAWNDHGDRPQEVAERLASSLHLIQTPEHVGPYVRLLTHVYGEHLGRWSDGVELLGALHGQLPAACAASARPIDVGVATLQYGGGNIADLEALSAPDQVAALSNVSSALGARGELSRAIAAYEQALHTAQAAISLDPPVVRALAAGGNNLAVALEARSNRSTSETQAMLTAAQAARTYWKRVGTWLEEERAEYRLARSQFQAGELKAAVQSAERCVAVCKRNAAPPFEEFFAHSVLACAHRASGNSSSFAAHRLVALGYLDQTSDDERKWCENERKVLEG